MRGTKDLLVVPGIVLALLLASGKWSAQEPDDDSAAPPTSGGMSGGDAAGDLPVVDLSEILRQQEDQGLSPREVVEEVEAEGGSGVPAPSSDAGADDGSPIVSATPTDLPEPATKGAASGGASSKGGLPAEGEGLRFSWPRLGFGGGKSGSGAGAGLRPEKILGGLGGMLLPGGRESPGGSGAKVRLKGQGSDENEAKVAELQRLAVTSFEKGRIDEAIRFINDLITIKPYQAEFHFALALAYRKDGRYRNALKKYQDVLDLGGPKALIALLKAEAYATENDLDKVYEMLKEAAIGGRNILADVENLESFKDIRRDTEFINLALQLERFEVMQGVRPDPFTNPFPQIVEGVTQAGAGSGSPKRLVLTPQEQGDLLHEAKTLFERIQLYIRLEDEDKAMTAYLRLKQMFDKQKLITVPRLVKEFGDVMQRLPDVEVQISGIRLRYYYNQAQAKLKVVREVFEDGEYARVQKLYVELEGMAREMTAANRKYKPVADEVMQRAKQWRERARVRLEFESQKPDIQGIVISGDGKLTILNGKVVRQGESLGNFQVVRIESNRVSFRYKGEEIPMVFRRY